MRKAFTFFKVKAFFVNLQKNNILQMKIPNSVFYKWNGNDYLSLDIYYDYGGGEKPIYIRLNYVETVRFPHGIAFAQTFATMEDANVFREKIAEYLHLEVVGDDINWAHLPEF